LTGDGNANLIEGGAGNDTLNGGAGIDTASYASAAAAVTVSLATLTAQNTVGAGTDTLSNFENLLGSAFNDTLTGDGNANIIDGGAGNDTMNGGAGTDTVSYASATAGVSVSLALTTAQNTIGAGTDTLSLFENLTGSAFGDTLIGNTAINRIDGGAGGDTLTGGTGADIFAFKPSFGADVITDFDAVSAAHDFMEFDHTIFANTAAVMAATTQVGADIRITVDASTSVTVKNRLVATSCGLRARPSVEHS